jgi:hypothetical protein
MWSEFSASEHGQVADSCNSCVYKEVWTLYVEAAIILQKNSAVDSGTKQDNTAIATLCVDTHLNSKCRDTG